jgi:hypothetical protein
MCGLSFESTDNAQLFFIPFYKIENIDMEFNIMSKTFEVETVHGNLIFAEESVKDIKRFYVSVQKALDSFNENNQEGNIIQDIVMLSDEEINFIKKRKE